MVCGGDCSVASGVRWRVLDAAVATGGAGDISFGGLLVTSADTEIRRLRYEVAQQLAYESQP